MAQQGTTREWEQEIPEDGAGHFEGGVPAEIPLEPRPDGTQPIFDALWEVATLLKRVGGVASIGARRVEIAKGVYRTRSVVIKWDSYGGPAVREPESDGE